ncbi:hypothetical protein LEP1GSC123_4580 [Leptospira borgpetersenii str. 200701203]|uniref:Uncharacterized protein n=1 Tax=Leptospira borgpetersenii str. 200701203 TaxID=1193007 RepID=M3GEJ6_LEPBO|nr:hypothetical protein LEP1GSC123_4580 [Leptospira borgpetersenii str. 200701203]
MGVGKSIESGVHSKVQTVLLVGTGIQWELESYFFNIALQYRKTDLIGATQSYHFNEPIFMIGGRVEAVRSNRGLSFSTNSCMVIFSCVRVIKLELEPHYIYRKVLDRYKNSMYAKRGRDIPAVFHLIFKAQR